MRKICLPPPLSSPSLTLFSHSLSLSLFLTQCQCQGQRADAPVAERRRHHRRCIQEILLVYSALLTASLCVCLHIHIKREREREKLTSCTNESYIEIGSKERCKGVGVYTATYVCICMYCMYCMYRSVLSISLAPSFVRCLLATFRRYPPSIYIYIYIL